MSDASADDWFARQYDPRLPDRPMPVILGEWNRRSADFLASTTVSRESFAYGRRPRETGDIYRAPWPRGVLVFLHGGYWMGCSKDEHAWIASEFVAAGLSVAILNYPLCPDVAIADIVDSARRAFVHLDGAILRPAERARVIVTGHSAGGHLAATLLVTDWRSHGVQAEPPAGAVCISGLFDLPPLLRTPMNRVIGFTAESAAALSLTRKSYEIASPLVLGVGALESAEFHRQSTEMASRWKGAPAELHSVGGRNHFDVLDDFATAGGILHRRALALFD